MLSVYGLDQSEKWDSIVRSFSQYDVYWLSGYVKAFKLHGDGEPLLFYYQAEYTRGINVVFKRDISQSHHFSGIIKNGVFFDFITPYGYGGWLIEGAEENGLFSEYEKWCRDNSIISEFVRFHTVIGNHSCSEGSYSVVPLGRGVVLDLSSPETVWANITSKNRNVIRKAIKNGVQVYSSRCPEIFNEFRKIYNSTMDKDNAEAYYYFSEEFYRSVCSDLMHNGQVFYAELNGKIIAASIILAANGKLNYHLSGSLSEYSTLAPTNLLLYEAALWGCENGCKTFLLGGGVGSREDGLFKFKKSFFRNDDLPRFYIGKKIFDQKKYDELLKIRGIGHQDFFPEYRV